MISKKWGLYLTSFGLYLIMPPIALGVGYRIYWRHGDFWSIEHIFMSTFQIALTLLGWYSHYMASVTDPGKVKPNHFRSGTKADEEF